MKLNLGCGETKLEGFINIDADASVNPDKLLDFSQTIFPYASGSVNEVVCTHTIEHLEHKVHPFVFQEVNRVLEIGGKLILAYPDAKKILEFYLSNKLGCREYWESAIFGRGITAWDRHRSLILTETFVPLVREYGFGKIKIMEEVGQYHNTVLEATKTFSCPELTDVLRRELKL